MEENGGIQAKLQAFNGNGTSSPKTNGNGHSNGSSIHSNGKSTQDVLPESQRWRVGLRSAAGKYLTAEPFGFKLNVSGVALKKRQTWTLLPDAQQQDVVCLRSHLNRFLSADKDGVVTCTAETPDQEERFSIEYHSSGQQWALRSVQHAMYLGGEADYLRCFEKTPVWWTCQLALHPQLHLKNVNRGRYLRLGEEEVAGDRLNPWGQESLMTLMQRDGRVAIRTADGRYLARGGELVLEVSEDTLFCLQIRCGQFPGLAFKDCNGRFLTNIGSTGTTKSKNQTVSKDELFVLEDSYPQIAVKAFNGRYASIRQGQDLNANQSEIDVTETYQMEYQSASGKWRFRTKDNKFWKLSSIANGVSASGQASDPSAQFEMEHQPKGRVTLKSSNGCYLSAKKLGAVNASSSEVKSEEQFQLILLNRPIVVFRCDYGFVGIRNSRLECNLVAYDTFNLEISDNGFYYIKGSEGYWSIQGDFSISFKGEKPEEFIFEFRSRACVAILAPNGCYVRGEQNGTVRADATEITDSCLWEY